MDACRICTLIFDLPPLELCRAASDTTICCICEEHNMGTIDRKVETVEMEYFVMTYYRHELESFSKNPGLLAQEIDNVLGVKSPTTLKRAKPAPSTVSKAKRGKVGKGAKPKIKPLLQCKHGCGATFITAGRKANHEARCIDNPDRALDTGD